MPVIGDGARGENLERGRALKVETKIVGLVSLALRSIACSQSNPHRISVDNLFTHIEIVSKTLHVFAKVGRQRMDGWVRYGSMARMVV